MARPSRAPRQRRAKHSRKGPRTTFVLTIIEGSKQGSTQTFESVATIGRTEENEVVLVGQGISRQHARVKAEGGVHLLEDLQSANGTRLNGEKIGAEPEVLRDGDYITVAEATLQFSTLDGISGVVTAETQLTAKDAREVDVTDASQAVAGPRGGLLGTRRRRLLAVVLAVGVAGAVLWKLFGQHAIDVVSDSSDRALVYSDEDSFFNAVFGLGQWDRTHPRHATINFEYLGGRATLQYGAWGIDKVGEVEILLNGERVSTVPLTMQTWIYGIRVGLPADKLKKGATNQITFDNTRNPPHRDPWEICYVQIMQEAIPPPDPLEAQQRFDLAKKAWEDREVEPGNMYRALRGFQQARNYLEGLESRPELYAEAVDLIDRVDKELTRRFRAGLFSAKRAEKLGGDLSKPRNVLIRTMRYFGPEDFRYRELKRYLDALVE